MPKKLLVIKNKDKDVGNWMETWDKPNYGDIGRIPHPARILALGGVGRGKTNVLKNLFLNHQNKKARKFKRLYILTCDLNSKEWEDCCPDGIFDAMPDMDLFDKNEKTLLIIDDFEFEKCGKDVMKKLSTLFRYMSSHKNLSIYLSYQSFFDCPSIVRKCSNVFIIYKPNSKNELTTIANRVGLEANYLKDLFKYHANGRYDNICVDHTIETPAPIRKNIYEVINHSDSEESSSSDDE